MNRTSIAAACGASAIAFTLSLAWSASAATSDAGENLVETVTVSVGRGTALKDLDVSTTILTNEAVATAPQFSIDQLLNRTPGVFTTNQPSFALHPTGGTFNIRGFGTTTNVNTLLMVDGAPANDAYFRTIDWAQFSKDQIQSVEVLRGGGASSLWGNLAMGGIVNIITEAPSQGVKYELAGGSFGTTSATATVGAVLNDKAAFSASYSDLSTDGYDPVPLQYRNPNMDATQSETRNLLLEGYFTPAPESNFYVKFLDHKTNEKGLTWDIARNYWETWRLSSGGATPVGGLGRLNFAAFYSESAMSTTNASQSPGYTIFNPLPAVPYVSQRETVSYQTLGGSAYLATQFGPLQDVKIGVDARRISATDPLHLFALAGQTGTLIAHAEHHFQGLFAQGVWRPERLPLEVTVGLREDFWQTTDGSINGVYKGVNFANVLASQTYDHLDPRLGAKYGLTSELDLRGAVYSNFAAPGMNQMYRSFISGVSYTTANPTLAPQTNIGEEIGADWHRSDFRVSATAFDNSLKNFIDYATVQSGCSTANSYCGTNISTISGGSLHQYVNAGDASLRGYELMGDWQVAPTLTVDGGFTATRAVLTSSKYTTVSNGVAPDPVGQQLGQVPKWTANLGATWTVTPKARLTLNVKSFPSYWNNTSHTQLNSSATLVDLGASYRISKGFEIYLSAQNVGATRYLDQGYGYTTTNGSTISGSTTPSIGMPAWVMAGVRGTF